ncbi:MAG: VWA domain-containing protein [Clostridia bacterium]|nr:VWA domain-containing protein [Clostridia bacterium]
MSKFKRLLCAAIVVSLVFALCACDLVEIYEPNSVTKENAYSYIDKFNIKVYDSKLIKGEIPVQAPHSEVPDQSMFMYELPDVANYDLDVKGNADVDVEIFIPIENSDSSIREVVVDAAKKFNAEGITLSDSDKKVSVSIRCLESSLAEEYILNGTYYPKGYIAANELYGILMNENGIKVSNIQNKTIGNTMGIVIAKNKYDELMNKYGEVNINTIVKANEAGDVSVGYTNPTNNPTGLNFVISMLSYFDANNPTSMEATTDFSNFQNTVSAVSYSTQQMKQSVEKGIIDAFVVERQAYESDNNMKTNFVFVPFGVRHDNPLYSVGEVSAEELQVLKLFGTYLLNDSVQQYATSLGFNKDENYESTVANYSGGMISEILEFWKQGKASGKKIVAVFVADKSGSMSGRKMTALKDSLKNAMQYVGEENKVGLLSYNSYVYIDLPISEFTVEQQEYFVGAIDSWDADGGTATNNALLIALKLIEEERQKDSSIKPIIILLSDGYTGSGYSLDSMRELIDVCDVPIYTIGYEADVKELERIAEINEGTFINATSDDVAYILKTLFDAEM